MKQDGDNLQGQIPNPEFHGAVLVDAASIVAAYLRNPDADGSNPAELFSNVHGTLLDMIVSPAQPAEPLPNPDGEWTIDGEWPVLEEAASPDVETKARAILESIGISFAGIEHDAAPPAGSTLAVPTISRAVPTTPPPAPLSAKGSATDKVPLAAVPVAVRSIQSELPLPVPSTRKVPEAKRELQKASPPKLPRNIKSIDDALKMNSIACLEDGRRVKDLSAHLATKGISEADYRAKWGLPPEYPMQAPSKILKNGPTYEIDFVTGRFKPVR